MQSQHPIPPLPRYTLTHAEPLFALLGALQCIFTPRLISALEAPSAPYTPTLYPLFIQRAGGYIMVTMLGWWVLGGTRERGVWRMVAGAGLVQDAFYIAGLWKGRGSRFGVIEGVVWVTTLMVAVARVSVLLGTGQ